MVFQGIPRARRVLLLKPPPEQTLAPPHRASTGKRRNTQVSPSRSSTQWSPPTKIWNSSTKWLRDLKLLLQRHLSRLRVNLRMLQVGKAVRIQTLHRLGHRVARVQTAFRAQTLHTKQAHHRLRGVIGALHRIRMIISYAANRVRCQTKLRHLAQTFHVERKATQAQPRISPGEQTLVLRRRRKAVFHHVT